MELYISDLFFPVSSVRYQRMSLRFIVHVFRLLPVLFHQLTGILYLTVERILTKPKDEDLTKMIDSECTTEDPGNTWKIVQMSPDIIIQELV